MFTSAWGGVCVAGDDDDDDDDDHDNEMPLNNHEALVGVWKCYIVPSFVKLLGRPTQ